MQKRENNLGVYLPPVQLTLDDLKAIYEEFKTHCTRDVSIQTKDHVLDSLDELEKVRSESLSEIEISGRDPYLSLKLSNKSIWLYAATDDAVSFGVFEKLRQFLLAHQQPPQPRKDRWVSRVGFLVSIVGLVSTLEAVHVSSWHSLAWTLPILSLGYALMFLADKFRPPDRPHLIFHLKPEVPAPSFWAAKKHDIWVLIIGAVIGGAINGVVNFLTKK